MDGYMWGWGSALLQGIGSHTHVVAWFLKIGWPGSPSSDRHSTTRWYHKEYFVVDW